MKKTSNWLQKKVLCSLLTMAAVGVCGSAFADGEDWFFNDGKTYYVTYTPVNALDVCIENNTTFSFTSGGNVTLDSTSKPGYYPLEAWGNSTVNFGTSEKKLEQLTLKTGASVTAQNCIGIISNSTVNVYATTFNVSSATRGGILIQNGGKLNVNADNVKFQTKSTAIECLMQGSSVNINAKAVDIKSNSTDTDDDNAAIWVQNNTQAATAPENAASVTIKADTINLTSNKLGVVAFSNGQVNLNGDTTITADRAIDVRGNSTVNINTDTEDKHTTVINGDIVFETPATPQGSHSSGNVINANVNVNLAGEGSSWTGKSYQEYKTDESQEDYSHVVELEASPFTGNVSGFQVNLSDGAAWNMTGDSFVNEVTADNAAINVADGVEKFNVKNVSLDDAALNVAGNTAINISGELDADDAALNLEGENSSVKVNSLTGDGLIVNTESLDNKVSVTSKSDDTSVAVNGGSAITDAIASGKASIQDLANIVTAVPQDEESSSKSIADTITTEANDINGGYSATLGEDGKVDTNSVKTYENGTNRAVSDMASLSLMTWRQENNDMNKRLGELRDSKGQHGAWVRMARGESKYGSKGIKNQYNYYQVGYDEKLSNSPNWTVGVALTRTEGDSTFSTGRGENKHTGVALYGSYLADNGSFIDLVAKYARMDNDYKTIGAGVGDADYETNGYSLGAEYGKRFTKDSGLWFEPQVELTYGKVSSADYLTSKGARVRQEGMDSLVARLGFSLGQNFKQGNAYVRASYLYDFDGETDVTMSKAGAGSYKYEQDLGGGWWEVGVGTNINLSAATHLYFDVEKTYGGSVATPWQWNAGVRYSF